MFDYEVVRFIWWLLIGILLVGFSVTDGFDMGVGALLPFVGKTDNERRVMINSIAPHWDGNQVWLITAGGAMFAAWPLVYATSFSGFYLAMIITLAALWLRPVGFDYRSKIEDKRWRTAWDYALCAGGAIPALIFGVAFGNLFQGVAFDLNDFLMPSYHGSFFDLLNPFALLCGGVSLSMYILQGGSWLLLKTTDDVYERSRKVVQGTGIIVASLFAIGGICIFMMDGFVIKSAIDHSAPSNPLLKQVVTETAGWLKNYNEYPVLWLAPIAGITMPLLTAFAAKMNRHVLAFISSSLTNAAVIFTAGFALFPFIMPSSVNASHSLTMWDSTSSQLTLNIMTYVAIVMVPVILAYTSWGYYKMFGRLTTKHIEDNKHSLY